jgi:hypothetical protein
MPDSTPHAPLQSVSVLTPLPWAGSSLEDLRLPCLCPAGLQDTAPRTPNPR